MLFDMKHRDVAERFIATRFPGASIAIVAGSTARGERTASSDIDLLLVGDGVFDDARQSMAGGFAFEGEFFEVFAYTGQGFTEWAERALAQYRPVIVHMLVEGVEIRGGEPLRDLRARWAPALAAGPALDAHELDLRRYVITDQLDDLRDARDPLEQRVLASVLFEKTAELMLLTERRWIGAGKYLPRRLRELSPDRTHALARPLLEPDFAAFADAVEAELERAGGRVQIGFVR